MMVCSICGAEDVPHIRFNPLHKRKSNLSKYVYLCDTCNDKTKLKKKLKGLEAIYYAIKDGEDTSKEYLTKIVNKIIECKDLLNQYESVNNQTNINGDDKV